VLGFDGDGSRMGLGPMAQGGLLGERGQVLLLVTLVGPGESGIAAGPVDWRRAVWARRRGGLRAVGLVNCLGRRMKDQAGPVEEKGRRVGLD
jgi:hypothetical protein